jgi:hypothetical protein
LPISGIVQVLVALLSDRTAAQTTDLVITTLTILEEAKTQAANQPRALLLERGIYLRRPQVMDVRLSPDGRTLSFLRRGEKGEDLMLQNVSNGDQERIASSLQRVDSAWSGDGRRPWFADEQGLAVCESSDLSSKRILKWDSRREQRLLGVDSRAPRYTLIQEKVLESGADRYRYLRVDPQGKNNLLLEAAWPMRSVLLNADGDLAFTAAYDGPGYETVIRQYTAGEPRELLRSGILEEC